MSIPKMIMMVFFSVSAVARANPVIHVRVREGHLRDRPSYLGIVTAVLEYGDPVGVRGQMGPWRHVIAGDKEGWIHESALTRRRVELSAGEEDAARAADRDEIALAGKGFNADTEAAFRSRRRHIDFAWVDYMETLGIDPVILMRFLREGAASQTEGDR